MNDSEKEYLFIPTPVRYSYTLPPNAKLLFGEIANRANEKGEAIFNYNELPEIFNVNKKAVYLWISALEKEGFILSKMFRKRQEHFHAFIILIKPQPEQS